MKKVLKGIIGAWRTAAGWLAKWGADRWMHLVVGLALAFGIGCVASGERWEAGLVGLLVTACAGFLKEVADACTGENGDLTDLLFTVVGGLAGYGLLMLAYITI